MPTSCCEQPQPVWSQRLDGALWSDVYGCSACGHEIAAESWPAPLAWPGVDRCVNCGGEYAEAARGRREAPKCARCGLTAQQDKAAHDALAAAHPERSYVKGAEVALALGRRVLALKLATAAVRWGAPGDHHPARKLRVEAMESLGLTEQSLDEVYDWAHNGSAPTWVWSLIAALEAGAGNLDGAFQALKYGLTVDPTDLDMWSDYADLLLLERQFSAAVDAARHVIAHPSHEERALGVVRDAATALLRDGRYHDTRVAALVAGPLVEQDIALTWLLAQAAIADDDLEQAIAWIDKTLRLNPEHVDAQLAMGRLRPEEPKKRGWFW